MIKVPLIELKYKFKNALSFARHGLNMKSQTGLKCITVNTLKSAVPAKVAEDLKGNQDTMSESKS